MFDLFLKIMRKVLPSLTENLERSHSGKVNTFNVPQTILNVKHCDWIINANIRNTERSSQAAPGQSSDAS